MYKENKTQVAKEAFLPENFSYNLRRAQQCVNI